MQKKKASLNNHKFVSSPIVTPLHFYVPLQKQIPLKLYSIVTWEVQIRLHPSQDLVTLSLDVFFSSAIGLFCTSPSTDSGNIHIFMKHTRDTRISATNRYLQIALPSLSVPFQT